MPNLSETDEIIANVLAAQLDFAIGRSEQARSKFREAERTLADSNYAVIPNHELLRFLRVKNFLHDFSLPASVRRMAKAMGPKLPLWVDFYFQINTPSRGAALLDFGDFYYLPVPKNASSSIASHWCLLTLHEKTIDPHSFHPNPFFETVDVATVNPEPGKPIVCISRDEQSRLTSYFKGNVIQRDSLSKHKGIPIFMGLKVKPSWGEFKNRLDLYKLVFDDAMHHLLPTEAYLQPYREFNCEIIDFANLRRLEDLYPKIFHPGFFDYSHLMKGD